MWRICECFLSIDEQEDREMTRSIDKMLASEKKTLNRQFKLLLLGTGESGKSTFIKQMQIICGDGFSDRDRAMYKTKIFQNIYTIVLTLSEAMNTLEIGYGSLINYGNIQKLLNEGFNKFSQLTEEDGENIKSFWEDEGVQQCYSRSNEYQLIDPTEYFMTSIERITKPDYVPTTQDIIQTRSPTTNIIENDFIIQKRIFRIIDVGGQKSERKKWLNVFHDLTSIIFLSAISEYDQTLFECARTNRMRESIALFETLINRDIFVRTTFILFLNKQDLFAKKITKSNFSNYFPEYKGADDDVERCKSFILQIFLRQNKNKEKPIYNHYTCATDTENIRVIFDAVKISILETALGKIGL